MSDFAKTVVTAPGVPPDPRKRVNYAPGLVLGVDDYTQEFAYLSGRTAWSARDLIGYGTVSGLEVQAPPDFDIDGPQLIVTAGTAVSPGGRLIHVPAAQHAFIDKWLDQHAQEVNRRAELRGALGLPDQVTAYLVLCYRDYPTEDRPVPGERCRTDEGPTVPSRVQDDFNLELRFDPPDQREEAAVRRFIEWLTRVEISDQDASRLTLEEFVGRIRDASPFTEPDAESMASPPQPIRIATSDACEYLEAAFRLWVTELRPPWMSPGSGMPPACNAPLPDDSVLLAALEIPIGRDGGRVQVDRAGSIALREELRPFVVHVRALQQWLVCGVVRANVEPVLHGDVTGPLHDTTVERIRRVPIAASPAPLDKQVLTFVDDAAGQRWMPAEPRLGGDVTGLLHDTTVERIRHVPVAERPTPSDRQVLTFDRASRQWMPSDPPQPSDTVESELTFGQTERAGRSAEYSRADHTHGTPPLDGDLGKGRDDKITVESIQRVPITATDAKNGQVLTFVRDQWAPADLPMLTPSGSVKSETAFSQQPAAGTSADYSRADHTHGTPPAPVLDGDVTGAAGATTLKKIQEKPIDAPDPQDGQVLTFDKGANVWTPRNAAAAGSFVLRSDIGTTYAIVAAAILRPNEPLPPQPQPVYNKLVVQRVERGLMILNFSDYRPPNGTFQYIVKITPVTEGERTRSCVAEVGNFFDDTKGFEVLVFLDGKPIEVADFPRFRFMVEVSQYPFPAR